MKKIYIVGYPKSGNTWLSRCVANIFQCTISSYKNRNSIAQRDYPKNPNYTVIQEHLMPGNDKFPAFPEQETMVFIYRHPFDIATSIKHYFETKTIKDAIDIMLSGSHFSFTYPEYINAWRDKLALTVTVSYESMVSNTAFALLILARELNSPYKTDFDKIEADNSMANTRQKIKDNPKHYSYNLGIQMKNLRKGTANDWVNHFSKNDALYALEHFKEPMTTLGIKTHSIIDFLENND